MRFFRRLYWLWKIIEVNHVTGGDFTEEECWSMADKLAQAPIAQCKRVVLSMRDEVTAELAARGL